MPPLDDDLFIAGLRGCTAALAAVAATDLDLPVPTCPGWTVRQLATHVGRGHLWAAHIVTTRSQQAVSPRDVPNGKMPDGREERAAWLNGSAEAVATAVAAAGDEPVWTFLGTRPARFWLRRRAHEVAVHLADAQLACGAEPDLPAGLAADGIGEWLEMTPAFGGDGLRGDGETLHFHATDPDLGGAGEWLVRRAPGGVITEPGHAKADVAVRGPADRLLLVLTRRLPPATPAVEVFGDGALLEHWLANTPF